VSTSWLWKNYYIDYLCEQLLQETLKDLSRNPQAGTREFKAIGGRAAANERRDTRTTKQE
jgi:hypothetical protein